MAVGHLRQHASDAKEMADHSSRQVEAQRPAHAAAVCINIKHEITPQSPQQMLLWLALRAAHRG